MKWFLRTLWSDLPPPSKFILNGNFGLIYAHLHIQHTHTHTYHHHHHHPLNLILICLICDYRKKSLGSFSRTTVPLYLFKTFVLNRTLPKGKSSWKTKGFFGNACPCVSTTKINQYNWGTTGDGAAWPEVSFKYKNI